MFEHIRTIRIEGDRADATAEVPAEHPMLADHFPGRAMLPATWLVELASQVAGPLAETLEPGQWAVLASIEGVKLFTPVDLPVSLDLEATIVRRAREIVTTRVTVWRDDVTVLRGELVFALVAPPQGTEAAVRERTERLWRLSKH